MSQARDLFRLRHLVSQALTGGRAPISWQREIGRQTARLDTLRQASAWVETLAVARPTLRDGPLLGRCLAILTSQVPRSSGVQPEELRPQPPWFTWPERPLERDWEMVPAGDRSATPSRSSVPKGPIAEERAPGESPSRRPAPVPFRLEREAGRALLGRLAGETAPVEGTSRTRRRLIVETLRPKTSAPPVVSQDPAAHRDWLHELARRTERSLHHDGVGVPSTPRPGASDQLKPGETSSPADQWVVPISGLSAPKELLDRLVSTPLGSSDGSGRKAQSEPRSQHPSGDRSSGLPGRPTGEPGTENDGLGRRGRLESAISRTSTARSPGLPGTLDVEDGQRWQPGGLAASLPRPTEGASAPASRTGDVTGELESPARIVPPVVAPSLPPLLPSREAGRPSPPAAAAAVRQGARQEEAAAAEEHLSELAAKIKRILDEEARRHGIDA